jgi:hypothetical protein
MRRGVDKWEKIGPTSGDQVEPVRFEYANHHLTNEERRPRMAGAVVVPSVQANGCQDSSKCRNFVTTRRLMAG